ncbi:Nudix hydrolase isoform 1 [Hibiscus syriacus]|uniref:Nudix hydrolase isoform 1 n=1 Tax=Hibiscus syriacus TaxID=106335 RepID=A0A6A2Y7C7_HIBSY|nr:Nudix hydrolase isoform 1 [Hibiscus syriacus]
MSYPESSSSFMRLPQSTFAGTEAIGIWPESDPHSEAEPQQQQPPFKRPRLSEDGQSSVVQCLPANSWAPLNPPVNKGANKIFFKTVCVRNLDWGLVGMLKVATLLLALRVFASLLLIGKNLNDMGRFRKSSGISVGTTGPPAAHGTPSDQQGTSASRPGNSTGSDAFRGNMKPAYPGYWKTKLCTKWEITGHCPFGEKCHFAHGQSELKSIGVRFDGDFRNAGPGLTIIGSIATKMHNLPAYDPPKVTIDAPPSNEEKQAKKCLLKWKEQRNQ